MSPNAPFNLSVMINGATITLFSLPTLGSSLAFSGTVAIMSVTRSLSVGSLQHIYHSTGLLATHCFRSTGIPCLLYIDDRHTDEISFSRVTPVNTALSSDRERTFARTYSAIFIVCYTLSLLGYFIGLKKSISVPRQRVPYLGIGIDSVRQAFTLLEEKRLKFIALAEFILSSKTVDV